MAIAAQGNTPVTEMFRHCAVPGSALYALPKRDTCMLAWYSRPGPASCGNVRLSVAQRTRAPTSDAQRSRTNRARPCMLDIGPRERDHPRLPAARLGKVKGRVARGTGPGSPPTRAGSEYLCLIVPKRRSTGLHESGNPRVSTLLIQFGPAPPALHTPTATNSVPHCQKLPTLRLQPGSDRSNPTRHGAVPRGREGSPLQ